MNTGVVAGILQKMQETSYQKCRAEHPDERVVPQKLQVRDIGERVAEDPQPQRQQHRHTDDANRGVRQFTVSLFRENLPAEDAKEDDGERLVAEDVDEVADHWSQEKTPAFCTGN